MNEGQSDGSGEEDLSTLGSSGEHHAASLHRFIDPRQPSDGSNLHHESDYPSTTLWSNSSR